MNFRQAMKVVNNMRQLRYKKGTKLIASRKYVKLCRDRRR